MAAEQQGAFKKKILPLRSLYNKRFECPPTHSNGKHIFQPSPPAPLSLSSRRLSQMLFAKIKMAVCAEAKRTKECVGDADAGETETGRCLCAWRVGVGGYEWEMSFSDVTSAVSC